MANNLQYQNGRTALHIASIHGNVSAMEVLLRYDADVHAADKVADAVERGHISY